MGHKKWKSSKYQSFEKAGANLELWDRKGNTPLILAILENKNEIAQELLKDQKVNIEGLAHWGGNPLYAAIIKNNSEMITELLKAGANPSHQLRDGRTMLDLANASIDPLIKNEMVQMLREKY